ncbi:phosphoribosyltransferase family protein [Paraburkholderia heleia]|uniref:phosphoribosyltransferase family protein n=1 Tax=Paraburkholderia heleia TaxID=634127 RepID=UPI003CD05A4F
MEDPRAQAVRERNECGPVAFAQECRIHDRRIAAFEHRLIVRKLGSPQNPEVAMGAIASGDARYVNNAVLRAFDVSEAQLADIIARERIELQRRESAYRGQPAAAVEGKTVIVVDDGMATGTTMHAALKALRARRPKARGDVGGARLASPGGGPT